jgi:hypothetical protein
VLAPPGCAPGFGPSAAAPLELVPTGATASGAARDAQPASANSNVAEANREPDLAQRSFMGPSFFSRIVGRCNPRRPDARREITSIGEQADRPFPGTCTRRASELG